MGHVTKNFLFAEFGCPCGKCRFADGYQITRRLVTSLQKMRDKLGKPIRITSGIRCPVYNRYVRGARNSYHMLSRAVDIQCTSGLDRHVLCKVALSEGLSIGISEKFLHLDTRYISNIFLY
jgi:uncharacterized protein YcbK (DUF882 family)